MLRRWFSQLADNYRLLRRAADGEGKRLEALPYETLVALDDGLAEPTVFEGREVCYSTQLIDVQPNGDAQVCVDAVGLPTWFGVKPSYVFYKRPDGSVHYGEKSAP